MDQEVEKRQLVRKWTTGLQEKSGAESGALVLFSGLLNPMSNNLI
jgi:hypothetical protein